jgi:hypothetical protein
MRRGGRVTDRSQDFLLSISMAERPTTLRTGVAYLGHPNPRHLRADPKATQALGCDDVLLGVQEIDLAYFPGKYRGLPSAAADLGLRPVALLWGALNLFGRGRSSQLPTCWSSPATRA